MKKLSNSEAELKKSVAFKKNVYPSNAIVYQNEENEIFWRDGQKTRQNYITILSKFLFFKLFFKTSLKLHIKRTKFCIRDSINLSL